ncbi:uncharacterized protein P174DRAFT_125889 [Aspergillus novofumigatus IBT 16806]|uniref:Uncharacterized protein n=1 Tax=Aspergillus novofumigatus (strain IBT 16806) TaxID=1392255 RepID=A0A2I1CBT1_ASPN1|nr:uncharacterized protein P174DRAFT_125889 [Aspergillus novofumigatus IBT 16806]PKX95087.1 hypothetical protein P174DRAFT_125889 [Aspergillus novofumigatus IBT 16806]
MLRYTQWVRVVVLMSQSTPYPPLALAQVLLHSFDGDPPFQVATVIRKSQLGDKSKKGKKGRGEKEIGPLEDRSLCFPHLMNASKTVISSTSCRVHRL